jgi:hypothetical protein
MSAVTKATAIMLTQSAGLNLIQLVITLNAIVVAGVRYGRLAAPKIWQPRRSLSQVPRLFVIGAT